MKLSTFAVGGLLGGGILFALAQSAVAPAVSLRIRQAGTNGIELSWSTSAIGAVVETTATLDPPAPWQPVSVPVGLDLAHGEFFLKLETPDQTRFFRLRLPPEEPLPGDPATQATRLPGSVVTDVGSATRFLYDSPNPVQRAVIAGVLAPARAVVLRGPVLEQEGQALAGARISVLGHSEFGYTLSRADGRYDLVVNGGGRLTVVYEKPGYLSAQRTTTALPWQDYVELPPVALVRPSERTTPVALGAGEAQVAQGEPVTDADGTRQATLLVPPETQAELVFPDGSVQALETITVRATELTVGENGPAAMPAELPPGVGYTYCVDLRADEVEAAGAAGVRFDRPLFHYVENFLGFPIGGVVPVGYYDPDRAEWLPAENGRIIALVSVTDSRADLDLDGSGLPASESALAALGITAAERRQLARRYAVGQSLWRVSITHFSAWDFNWGWGPPTDATPPPLSVPIVDFVRQSQKLVEQAQVVCGTPARSFIEDQNQVLHEEMPLTGTPFTLHYSSLRVPGRRAACTLVFPVSFAELPSGLKRIEVEIHVAGRVFQETLPPDPDQEYTFTWDGRDAYGRILQGAHPVTVRVGYVYRAFYQNGWDLARAFGYSGNGVPLSVDRVHSEFTFWKEWQDQLGTWDARGMGLGGWTLSAHHAYDPTGRILWLGAGGRHAASSAEPVIRTVAGGGDDKFSEDIPAVDARLWDVEDVAVAPDGTLYVVRNTIIRRVTRDGRIETYAGGGRSKGEFVPAREAYLQPVRGLALAPDGRLYFSQYQRFGSPSPGNHGVRVITPEGLVHTVVNAAGVAGFAGDGGPALDALLDSPGRLALGADGSLYIADTRNNRIRKVAPDGIIQTVAGGGESLEDGVLATEAQLRGPQSVAVSPEGVLYIAQFTDTAHGVRQVDLDGVITTLTPASGALDVSLAPNSDVLVTGRGGLTGGATADVWRVTPDGALRVLAGLGGKGRGYVGEDGPAYRAALEWPLAITAGPRGILYLSANDRVLAISSALPGFNDQELAIASAEGGWLYHFDRQGRHLRTLHTLTGAVLWTFGYDAEGRLLTIDDGRGNVTTIERDTAGAPVAIIAPFGQRTELALDDHGFLKSVTDPAGRITHLVHTPDGLLTRLTRPGDRIAEFRYDANGRLLRDENAAGGFVSFERQDEWTAYTVTRRTAEGVTQEYRVEQLDTGQTRLVNQLACCGVANEVLLNRDASIDVTYANGTVTHHAEEPDPRFGMEAPVRAKLRMQTPGGLIYTATRQATAELAAPSDPLSLIQSTWTAEINERLYTSVFDAETRTATTTTPEGRIGAVTLDEWGRVVRSEQGGREPVLIAYDVRNRIQRIAQGDRAATFTYDLKTGYLAAVTNALLQTTRYERDVLGRLTTLTWPDGSAWRFARNTAGQVERITEPDHATTHTFGWTPFDQLAFYRSPLGATNRFAYDRDHRLRRHELPSGETIEWRYNPAGRLREISLPVGAHTYAYEAATGRLTNVVSRDGQQIHDAYDGAVRTNATWSGVAAGVVEYRYDHDLRLAQITYGGQPLALGYDADSLLTRLGEIVLERDAVTGLTTALTDGDLRVEYGRNGYGEVDSVQASYGEAVLCAVVLTYDKRGRVSAKEETVAGTTHTWAFAYDAQSRLTEVRQDGVVVESYTYDAVGNRIGMTSAARDIDRRADDYEYDADHKLLRAGHEACEYDANGRLARRTVGDSVTDYHYRADGTLGEVDLPDGRIITYRYDAAHRRVAKLVDGVVQRRWVYGSGLTPLAEYDGAGTLRTVYFCPGSALPTAFVRDGVRYRVIQATFHSPLLILGPEGTVVKRVDYDTFGFVLADSNPAFDFPFGFTGGLADPDTGLVHLGFRDYDPVTGRWTAPDPVLFAGGFHLYAYCANDPVNRVDRDGLIVEQGPSYGRRTLKSNTSTTPDAPAAGVYGCRPPPLPNIALQEGGDHGQSQARVIGTVAQAVPEVLPTTQPATGDPGSSSSVEGKKPPPAGGWCIGGTCLYSIGGIPLTGVPEDYSSYVETTGVSL